jgi:hypothetical protein
MSGRLDQPRLAFSFLSKKSDISNFGNLNPEIQMPIESPNRQPLKKGHQPRMTNDGYQPRPAPSLGHIHQKVQGGYQAPSGGGKPTPPTTGSGVKPAAPATVSGEKK